MRKVDKAMIIPVKYINEINNLHAKLQKKKVFNVVFPRK